MNQVFDVKISVMENVDLDIIANIEYKCFNGEKLSQNEVDYYLNYVVYQTRKILALNRQKDINSYNFNFMCDLAQSIIARYFEKLKISYKPVETGKAITSDILGHSFLIADFNLDDENKSYIIDPTYNQFFDVSKCAENNFKVINGIVVKTPDLGYFALRADDNVQSVVKKLLKAGYIELTENNAKVYGDLFYKTKTGSVNYFNSDLEMAGSVYIKSFKKSLFKLSYTEEELEDMGMSLNTFSNFNHKKMV